MQEHVKQQVSHWFTAHTTLEASGMAVNVELLDGDLCISADKLSAVCAAPVVVGSRAAVGVGGGA